jgi:hypothetical protein|nr:MAG: carbon monoxide dehydrogenase [Pseudomonadota bacterium]
MAVNMSGEVILAADRERVWAMLNDPEVLKICIPGCETFEPDGENTFRAVARVKIGPVNARFKGKVSLSDIDAPNSYKISGEGEGGVAGFAKGGAAVRLEPTEDGGTRLIYDVEANVGGKIAQLGSRLINSVAKKNADTFFIKFAEAVGGGTIVASEVEEADPGVSGTP